MDEQIPSAITDALRARGVDVLTVQEDDRTGIPDVQVLDRALILERVLFTRDKDFLRETASRQRFGREFFGVVFARLQDVSIAGCIDDLELRGMHRRSGTSRDDLVFS
jgi:predicted nuclease of predicted toxin-antitoxin system